MRPGRVAPHHTGPVVVGGDGGLDGVLFELAGDERFAAGAVLAGAGAPGYRWRSVTLSAAANTSARVCSRTPAAVANPRRARNGRIWVTARVTVARKTL